MNEINNTNPPAPVTPMDPKKERTWATFCHITALIAFLGIPFGNILGPFIVWILKKNEMPLVDEEGKESLNFQISMSIYILIAGLLCLVFVGFLLLFPLIIADLVLVIIASIKISNNETFKYPFTIRLIK